MNYLKFHAFLFSLCYGRILIIRVLYPNLFYHLNRVRNYFNSKAMMFDLWIGFFSFLFFFEMFEFACTLNASNKLWLGFWAYWFQQPCLIPVIGFLAYWFWVSRAYSWIFSSYHFTGFSILYVISILYSNFIFLPPKIRKYLLILGGLLKLCTWCKYGQRMIGGARNSLSTTLSGDKLHCLTGLGHVL